MALHTVVGTLLIVAIHTAIAAVVFRFFRLQLRTTWGLALYSVVFVPLVLLVSTFVLSGVLRLGGGADRQLVLLFSIVIPIGLGVAIDLFWMPSPDEVELPDTTR